MPSTVNALEQGSAGIIGFNGSTFDSTAVTQFNVLSGSSTTDTLNNIAPTATSGVPLISQGSSSQPIFGTAVVAGGGSGATSFTAFAPIAGGTTTTAALQSASTGIGTSGNVLTSTGASSLPTFQALPFVQMPWTDEATSFNAIAGNGYFVTGTATATMPASPSQGNTIGFFVDTTNILTVTANTGQTIRVGSAVSASAGTCANHARGDSIIFVYRASDTQWCCIGGVNGTWTVT